MGIRGVSLQGSNFFHDFSKNNIKLDAGLYLRVFKGFFFNVSGSYSRVRDQLALPQLKAMVSPANERSIRLLEKLGMRAEGSLRPPGEDKHWALYGIVLGRVHGLQDE